MDTRNVIAFRAYPHIPADQLILCADELAREALGVNWGDTITVDGRRRCTAVLQPLDALDQNGRMARITEALCTKLMIEYGEDLLLSSTL